MRYLTWVRAKLDVTAINVATVNINGSTASHNGHLEDVNDNGIADLVAHLNHSGFGIATETPRGTVLTLTLIGEFKNGVSFLAHDDVRINGNISGLLA